MPARPRRVAGRRAGVFTGRTTGRFLTRRSPRDFSKRKVRFSLEPLDTREVPAQLVELPYAAAPEAQVALTAPADLGQGPEAGLKIDGLSLNYTKITFASLKLDSAGSADLKVDLTEAGAAGTPSDAESAGKVQFQDIHFTGKVQMQDFNFVMKNNKASPTL